MLSACGKPIVGHNIVIDLAYILAQFVGPLPSTMEGYKRMIHHTFPMYVAMAQVVLSAVCLR
jgi:poly(A)-specific ribonuclease